MSKEGTRVSNRLGRPNYPPEYKQQIAVASCEPGISVTRLAQAHGLSPNMVFKWRRQYRAGELGPTKAGSAVLIPVDMPALPAPPVPTSTAATQAPQTGAAAPGIEIELNGARVRVTGRVDPVQLRLVLRCLMPA